MPHLLATTQPTTRVVHVAAAGASLTGELATPLQPRALVVFCHTNADLSIQKGDRSVAAALRDRGYATLLFDLLTPDEEMIDATTRHLRCDLSLLARRLIETIDWLAVQRVVDDLPLAFFGDGYGAAAALVAACVRPQRVRGVITRDGRTGQASAVLRRVPVPVLLIADGNDPRAVHENQAAFIQLRGPKELVLLDGTDTPAGSPGDVAHVTVDWLERHVLDPRGAHL